MTAEKSLAIVIRRVEFSESSYVTTLFTDSHGKIAALAKGARRAKSSFENALDLLSISRVVFLRKSGDSLDLLTEARLERPFRAARRSLQRLNAGFYVAELLDALTLPHDPHPQVFRSALETLVGLDEQVDVGLQVLRFEITSLRELGHLPGWATCAACGRPIDASATRIAFGQLAGGLLCSACRTGRRKVISLSRRAVQTLDALSQGPVDARLIALAAPVRGELRGLMNNLVSDLLGRRPRMYPFLLDLK